MTYLSSRRTRHGGVEVRVDFGGFEPSFRLFPLFCVELKRITDTVRTHGSLRYS